jgi:hypothetical protein
MEYRMNTDPKYTVVVIRNNSNTRYDQQILHNQVNRVILVSYIEEFTKSAWCSGKSGGVKIL